MSSDDGRSPRDIGISIGLGLLSSFVITAILGIEFEQTARLIISIVPPVGISLWAIRVRRISSMRLWGTISHGVTYGIINFIAVEFFSGLTGLI